MHANSITLNESKIRMLSSDIYFFLVKKECMCSAFEIFQAKSGKNLIRLFSFYLTDFLSFLIARNK